jgi:Flp pilus assembly protein TadG
MRSSSDPRRGQSSVELALVAPVLILLLVVSGDFAPLFFTDIALNHAARAGAQYGSQTVITAADNTGMTRAVTTTGASIAGLAVTTKQCICGVSATVAACGAGLQLRQRPVGHLRRSRYFGNLHHPHQVSGDADVGPVDGQGDHGGPAMRPRFPGRACRRISAGQAATEFAMLASTFVLLIFAVMQYALATFAYNAVAEASGEAARYASVHSPTSPNPATVAQIQAVATGAAPSLDPATVTVTVSWPADPTAPTQTDAKVLVAYAYTLAIPFITPISLTLVSTAQMVVSQ